ncbi:MAG: signal peptidase II [Actinomycetota bacterium]
MLEVQEGGRTPVGGASTAQRRAPAILAATMVATVAVDQVTKALAAHLLASGRPARLLGTVLDLQLTRNPGGAFGILQSRPLLFAGATVIIVAGVLLWGFTSGQAPVALGLVAGGGLGNLIDRIVRAPGGFQGHVVDFIHFRFWPTFNLADSSIVVGVALLLLLELRPHRQ